MRKYPQITTEDAVEEEVSSHMSREFLGKYQWNLPTHFLLHRHQMIIKEGTFSR